MSKHNRADMHDEKMHDMHKDPRRYTGMFAGAVLILLGILLLLKVIGVITFSMWHAISTYWPVGLILVGLAIIFKLRWLTIAFLIITVILCTAFLADTFQTTKIIGSGNIITKDYDVGTFSSIHSRIPSKVYLTQGAPDSATTVSILGDDNILEIIDVSTQDNTLTLRYGRDFMFWNVWNSDSVKVYISTPNIDSVRIDGMGSIIGQGPIVSDDLELLISGAGDMELDIVADNLDSEISGLGDLKLSGTVKDHDIVMSGAGDVEAFNLSTENTSIRLSGSGDLDVDASENLDVTISGAGSVKYLGTPQVTEHISGAGNVKQVE